MEESEVSLLAETLEGSPEGVAGVLALPPPSQQFLHHRFLPLCADPQDNASSSLLVLQDALIEYNCHFSIGLLLLQDSSACELAFPPIRIIRQRIRGVAEEGVVHCIRVAALQTALKFIQPLFDSIGSVEVREEWGLGPKVGDGLLVVGV